MNGLLSVLKPSVRKFSTHVKSNFCVVFHIELFSASSRGNIIGIKDVEFSCASFYSYEKFVAPCPPTPTPSQKLKIGFPKTSSQEIGSSLVSFGMIFQALQSELFRFKFQGFKAIHTDQKS